MRTETLNKIELMDLGSDLYELMLTREPKDIEEMSIYIAKCYDTEKHIGMTEYYAYMTEYKKGIQDRI